jgi:hypothetical protein
MLKEIAETIKGLVQIVASLLQVAMLAAVIWGGWWAYSTVSEFFKKPIILPFPEIKAPEFPKLEMPDLHFPTFGNEPKPDPNQPWSFGPAEPAAHASPAPKAPPGAWSFDNP